MLVSSFICQIHCQTVANSFMICTTMADERKKRARAHTNTQTHRFSRSDRISVYNIMYGSCVCYHALSLFLSVFLILVLVFGLGSWSCYSSSCFRFSQMLYDKISSHFLYRFKNPYAISSLPVCDVILERVVQLKHWIRADFDSNIHVCLCAFVCLNI